MAVSFCRKEDVNAESVLVINTKQLRPSRNSSGAEVWVCGHCGEQANEAETNGYDRIPRFRKPTLADSADTAFSADDCSLLT